MESNWRWNVYALGMSGSLYPLFARVLEGFFTDFYVSNGLLGNPSPVMWFPPVYGSPLNQFGSVTPPVPGNFPFGFVVEPD